MEKNNASYNNLVSTDAIYCNDRASEEYASSGYMSYAARDRLYHNGTSGRQPSYQCGQNSVGGYTNTSQNWVSSTASYTSSAPSTADKFSKTTGSGENGKLTYPVGLITADEIAFAGGLYGNNAPNTYYYLNSRGESVVGSTYWWTMSPIGALSGRAYVFHVGGSSALGTLSADTYSHAVRPIISLKPEVIVSSGIGTASEPYEVSL